MEQKNTETNNHSTFIYLFRYISSIEKYVFFSLLALIPLLWRCIKYPGRESLFFRKKKASTEYSLKAA